ncbi:MAG: hypothetical protein RIC19_24560 [Phaeodactylibacter sp.]|uniref:hypothetical protein n=1 Tax=Phaeodactylibacter sp. TaxID=1940289 RepID=UPI0032ECC7E2
MGKNTIDQYDKRHFFVACSTEAQPADRLYYDEYASKNSFENMDGATTASLGMGSARKGSPGNGEQAGAL